MITYHPVSHVKDYIFSIIIPTWNNLPFIKLCVESINKNSDFSHQIILHINEGIDGTLEWAQENNLDYTYSRENAGICLACNAAATLASTEYIMYLNDDMYACPGWDGVMMSAIKEYGETDFYFSATMIEPRYTGNKCTTKSINYGDSPLNFKESELLEKYQELYRADWSGSSWPPSIMHRKMWDLVGGFSIEFSPGMYSDPDLSIKLWRAGCRNFRGIGKSLFYHFMSKSVLRVKKNNGRKQFLNKWEISSSLFYKHYLKLGEEYNGPLNEPDYSFKFRMRLFKSKVKLRLGF